jgi:hypothetical protein
MPPPKRKHPPSGPAVNCAFDELVPLEKLVPNPRNPNQHPQAQVALLAKVIAHQGWRSPVVAGHPGDVVETRLKEAKDEILKQLHVLHEHVGRWETPRVRPRDPATPATVSRLSETTPRQAANRCENCRTGPGRLVILDGRSIVRACLVVSENWRRASTPVQPGLPIVI